MTLRARVKHKLHLLCSGAGLSRAICLCIFVLACLMPANGYAVNFSINPVRIFLDGKQKTNVLKIRNQSEENVSLQLRTVSWDHDSEGRNRYTPTEDIIFFPRILSIEKDEEKIIRIGSTLPQGDKEKTYRLFIEEIPSPDPVKSNLVTMVMKVGVPIFMSPVKTELRGSIESVDLLGGTLHLAVKNQGNAHFIVNSIEVTGKDAMGTDIYRTEIGGWYLHSGKTKEYTIGIPDDICTQLAVLNVNLSTDSKFSFTELLDVTKEMCSP